MFPWFQSDWSHWNFNNESAFQHFCVSPLWTVASDHGWTLIKQRTATVPSKAQRWSCTSSICNPPLSSQPASIYLCDEVMTSLPWGEREGGREEEQMVYAPPYTTTGFLYCIPGVAECISHFICCPFSLPLEVLGLYRQGLCLCLWPRYGKSYFRDCIT